MRELAMAIRWSSDAKIDLLTIDGAPGGTGMSPWRMMSEWGVPAIYLHSMAYELCRTFGQKRCTGFRILHLPAVFLRKITSFQGTGPGSSLLQSNLYGPRPDDSGDGG